MLPGAARDVRHELDSVHDGLEHVAVSERLVSLPAGELRAAALGSLDAITRLARSQVGPCQHKHLLCICLHDNARSDVSRTRRRPCRPRKST